MALSLHEKFRALRKAGLGEEAARKNLQREERIAHFARQDCFPRLFLLATSDSTGSKELRALEALAMARERVNAGGLTEREGEEAALRIACQVKQAT